MSDNTADARQMGTMTDLNAILDGGMVYFRARHLLQRCGVEDPHAHLFVSRAVQRRAGLTYTANPAVLAVSLGRFAFFSAQMATAAKALPQFLLLGVGYDTRALWLKDLMRDDLRVFEVDLPDKIAHKSEILSRNGIDYPPTVVAVPGDLTDEAFPGRLVENGFDPSRPTAVFAEGLFFQLQPESIERLLDPNHLGLAPGSELTFDFWSNARIDRRNRMEAANGRPYRFGNFPLPDTRGDLPAALMARGFRDVHIAPVRDVVEQYCPDMPLTDESEDPDDWLVVRATVR
ncbi:class I SAM-dependent methyltransferase [Bauldia litoralis]|uniref:S-adenosyl-L-methionine-dependent methyltransferase n=1 Tax=Bauldia litoralis TaxID=665467 RepID=A0A1G6D635_9HYPH|nr:SAM-dependent methyltransferase [Bauldia litoralis]SDB40568.1 Leucine carboxyl methyltransferase [Bauldia litoralis]